MATIELEAVLPADPDRVWQEVNRPALLDFVAAPLLRFAPLDPPHFPEVWEHRDYLVAMRFMGVLPVGRQTISISHPAPEGAARFVRDNGYGAMIRRWDHLITIEPAPGGTRYVDRLILEAGVLTPAIALFARVFYAHRQRRWRKLAAHGFTYG